MHQAANMGTDSLLQCVHLRNCSFWHLHAGLVSLNYNYWSMWFYMGFFFSFFFNSNFTNSCYKFMCNRVWCLLLLCLFICAVLCSRSNTLLSFKGRAASIHFNGKPLVVMSAKTLSTQSVWIAPDGPRTTRNRPACNAHTHKVGVPSLQLNVWNPCAVLWQLGLSVTKCASSRMRVEPRGQNSAKCAAVGFFVNGLIEAVQSVGLVVGPCDNEWVSMYALTECTVK